MKTEHIEVLPYDAKWKEDFKQIKLELVAVIGDWVESIEHVGSTSVEGLSAKPIIDIDVVIKDETILKTVIEKLATIDYIYEGDLGIKGREAFKYTGKEHLQTHHLYVCPKDSAELKKHCTFRDYLKVHPEAVAEYSHVKEEAARLYPEDIEKYIAYKSPCIEKIYKACGLVEEI